MIWFTYKKELINIEFCWKPHILLAKYKAIIMKVCNGCMNYHLLVTNFDFFDSPEIFSFTLELVEVKGTKLITLNRLPVENP